MLLSAYRRDEWADPEGFVAQFGVVLEGYPEPVIVAVTDPRTGLQRRLKWPPTLAEVVEACEAELVRLDTMRRYADMPRPKPLQVCGYVEKLPGRRANLFVDAGSAQYPELLEWVKTADEADWKYDPTGRGIWVNWLASPAGQTKCSSTFKTVR